jgi:hypothetical protein
MGAATTGRALNPPGSGRQVIMSWLQVHARAVLARACRLHVRRLRGALRVVVAGARQI